uniref:Potassium channel domain-containing protein n=1 Tax=Amphimedon queenslandica TaxID=400682 RepID=A0A1X7UXQ5_AMPQE
MYIILITHWSACAWFSIACDQLLVQRCKPTSWITMNNIGCSSSSVIHNYILSLYWSTTTTTLFGYGDIAPVNNDERVLAIRVMLLGIWCYGYMPVAAIITHTQVQFQKRLQAVQEFMKHNKLNREVLKNQSFLNFTLISIRYKNGGVFSIAVKSHAL